MRRRTESRLERLSVFALVGVVVALGLSCSDPAPGLEDGDPFVIYILGGSTAQGEPYEEIGGFGAAIRQLFRGHFANRPLIVHNFGRGGTDTNRILKTTSEISDAADLVILYTGNNEFLRFDTDPSPTGSDRRQFDEAIVDEAQRGRIFRRYEANIRAIVGRVLQKNIPIFVSTVAVNLADWQPNRSVLSNAAREEEIRILHARARRALRSHQFQSAADALRQALEIDPTFADSHKLRGDAHRELRRFRQARVDYQAAADLDGNPARVTSSQNEFLRRLALETDGVFLVDSAEIIEAASPNHLAGFNLFWDNCHPTLAGYYLIGRSIAEKMNEVFARDEHLEILRDDQLIDGLALTRDLLADVSHTRGQFLYASASRTWSRTQRLERAMLYLEESQTLRQSADVAFSIGVAHAIAGDRDAATAQWRLAARRDQRVAEERMRSPKVRRLIDENGWQDPIDP